MRAVKKTKGWRFKIYLFKDTQNCFFQATKWFFFLREISQAHKDSKIYIASLLRVIRHIEVFFLKHPQGINAQIYCHVKLYVSRNLWHSLCGNKYTTTIAASTLP